MKYLYELNQIRDGDRIIKIFEEGYTKSSILQEAYNQSVIETSEINAPKVLQVTNMDNKWAIISEFIPGKTLQQLMNESRNAANDPADYFEYIMFSWGNCQAGDRLVMERALGRFPDDEDLSVINQA